MFPRKQNGKTNISDAMFSVFWSLSQNKIQKWAAYRELAKNKHYLFNRTRHTWKKLSQEAYCLMCSTDFKNICNWWPCIELRNITEIPHTWMSGFKKSTNVICVIGAVCRFKTLCWEWHYNKARCNITNVNIRSCNAPSYRKQEYIQTGKSLIVILLPQLLYKATLILRDTCPVFAWSLWLHFHCSCTQIIEETW